MSQIQQQYNKIETFVTAEWSRLLDANRVLVKPDQSGLQVGKFLIRNCDNCWQVLNLKKQVLNQFWTRRSAILCAALLTKKQYQAAAHVRHMDQLFDIYEHDKRVYEQRYRDNPDNLTYKHRLNRVEHELDQLKQNLHELEKKADLQ
jgi:hypothetical protein